jgi:hypothetical protein
MRTGREPSTARSYAAHLRQYLVPSLGRIPLDDLEGQDVLPMIDRIVGDHVKAGKPISPASLARITATLRCALNAAMRRGLISSNPATMIELPQAAGHAAGCRHRRHESPARELSSCHRYGLLTGHASRFRGNLSSHGAAVAGGRRDGTGSAGRHRWDPVEKQHVGAANRTAEQLTQDIAAE